MLGTLGTLGTLGVCLKVSHLTQQAASQCLPSYDPDESIVRSCSPEAGAATRR